MICNMKSGRGNFSKKPRPLRMISAVDRGFRIVMTVLKDLHEAEGVAAGGDDSLHFPKA